LDFFTANLLKATTSTAYGFGRRACQDEQKVFKAQLEAPHNIWQDVSLPALMGNWDRRSELRDAVRQFENQKEVHPDYGLCRMGLVPPKRAVGPRLRFQRRLQLEMRRRGGRRLCLEQSAIFHSLS